MEKIKTIAKDFVSPRVLVKAGIFAVFLGISILAPLIKIQFVTGSIVNAILFLSTVILGVEAGILISFIPSLASGFIGLLPLPLLPMIPYIILGNIVLVVVFSILNKKNFWLGVVSASFLKFLILAGISTLVVATPLVAMMSWPQLITALMGGLIASIISSFF